MYIGTPACYGYAHKDDAIVNHGWNHSQPAYILTSQHASHAIAAVAA
jgi:hypothetical protein